MASGEPSTSEVPPGAGTTVGGKHSKRKSDIMSLDYCTFRVPYNELNVKFRNGQKDLDRAAASVARAANLLTKKTAGATEPQAKEALQKNFEFLLKQVQEARAAMQKVLKEETDEADKIIRRCHMLQQEQQVNEDRPKRIDRSLEKRKFARHICWHLLRCGMIVPAKKLVAEMKMEGLVDISIFEKFYEIEQALLDKDTKPCIEWCQYHRHRLRKIGSRIEVVARQQDIATLVEEQNIPEALAYIKKYFVPITKTQFPDDLKKIMGSVAMPLEISRMRNKELHAENRYEACYEFFIKEAYRLYQLPEHSAFSSIVQMGIAAQKTAMCEPDTKTPTNKQRCVVCRPDIWPLAEGLPNARSDGNKILCSLSNTVCNDEDNIPYLFPSGHVVGLRAINAGLRRANHKVYDPMHKQEIMEEEALRMYFM
ncbi:hypothetical protein L5515_002237 [Caenorhabditis briggsae]|uniref:E3 ubiquitin-protein transferase MAEA n=1 Tax=Caenorhabditis briggsae TaxID=6238 RepID=A0AAE9E7I2_CAEBR|nr:hypothetical protein L5515_002237 [Caenorhabditis briggsae]